MEEQNFDRFDDNTLTMDITVAEYRALVSFRAVAGYQMDELLARNADLEKQNKHMAEQIMMLQEEVADEQDAC